MTTALVHVPRPDAASPVSTNNGPDSRPSNSPAISPRTSMLPSDGPEPHAGAEPSSDAGPRVIIFNLNVVNVNVNVVQNNTTYVDNSTTVHFHGGPRTGPRSGPRAGMVTELDRDGNGVADDLEYAGGGLDFIGVEVLDGSPAPLARRDVGALGSRPIAALGPRAVPALPAARTSPGTSPDDDVVDLDPVHPVDASIVPDLTRETGPAAGLDRPATDAQRLLLGKAVEEFQSAMNKFASVDGVEKTFARHEVRMPGHEFERMEITFSRSSPDAEPVVKVRLVGQGELSPEANFGKAPPEVVFDISKSFRGMSPRDSVSRDESLVELGRSPGAAVLIDALKGFHLDDRDQAPQKAGALLNNSVVNYLATGVEGSKVTRLANADVQGFRGSLNVDGVIDNCTFKNCSMQINNEAGQKAEFKGCTIKKSSMPGCEIDGTLEFKGCKVGKDVLIGVGYSVEKPSADAGDGKMVEEGRINHLKITGGKFSATLDVPIGKLEVPEMKWAGYLMKIPFVKTAAHLYIGYKYGGMRVSDRAGAAALDTVKGFSKPWDPNKPSYNPDLKDIATQLLDENAELYRLLGDGTVEAVHSAADLKRDDRFLVKAGKDMIEVSKGGVASVKGWRKPENVVAFRKVELVGGRLAGVSDVSFVDPSTRVTSANGLGMLQSVLAHMNESATNTMPTAAKKKDAATAGPVT